MTTYDAPHRRDPFVVAGHIRASLRLIRDHQESPK